MLSIIFGELINLQKQGITREWTRLCSLKWKPQIKSQRGIRFYWISSTTVGFLALYRLLKPDFCCWEDMETMGLEPSISWLTWQLPKATKTATSVSGRSGKVWDYRIPSAISVKGSASSQWEAKHVPMYSFQLFCQHERIKQSLTEQQNMSLAAHQREDCIKMLRAPKSYPLFWETDR